MKTTLACVLLPLALASGPAYAAEQDSRPLEAEVQKDIDSIVSNCEKKKLPMEDEIKCIEKAFLEFMGVTDQEGS